MNARFSAARFVIPPIPPEVAGAAAEAIESKKTRY
jgi:hypothetical protein